MNISLELLLFLTALPFSLSAQTYEAFVIDAIKSTLKKTDSYISLNPILNIQKIKPMKYLLLCLFMLSLVACNPSKATVDLDANEQVLHSKHLNEAIPYRIHFPKNWESKTEEINLLVLLDGDEYYGVAQNTTALYEFGDKIKPTVVLALPSTAESRWAHYTPTKAKADNDGGASDLYQYTGQFNAFANFIEKELIPFVENNYKVDFQEKTIFGHSMGGLGVLSFVTLQPQIFDHYIAASPSTMYDEHYIFKTIEEKSQLEFKKLFLTAALNDENGYRENVNWLHQYLLEKQPSNQSHDMKIYEKETHGTSGLKSLIDGLEFIGKG